MPKIPTFTTEARPTAEAPSIQTRTQIPLTQTIGTASTSYKSSRTTRS